MSEKPILTVFAAKAERQRGTVVLEFTTEQGLGRLRLTPAMAQQLGTDLRVKAVSVVGEVHGEFPASQGSAPRPVFRPPAINLAAAAAAGLPLQKPGGGL